ncbi:MAG: DUF4129 domain-containing protein [Candidatus Heimdallarchaeota archaeon]|nr:DUF4129 domain-containing protein [Candidatus Heimdallarchaeota archaeon]
MKSLRTKLVGVILFLTIIMQMSTVALAQTQSVLENSLNNSGSPTYRFGQSSIDILNNKNHPTRYEYYPEIITDTEKQEVETENKLIYSPATLDLSVHGVDTEIQTMPAIMKSITSPTPLSYILRDTTINVEGVLQGIVVGDYWGGETVWLFYNVTESQFTSSPATYETPQYQVGSATTNSQGQFTIALTTSALSIEPFSKVGEITLLAWFYGNPGMGRGAGSPGDVNVYYFGQIKLDVGVDVTNPLASYSFTTRVLFDNDTVIDTTGTAYTLKVDWSLDGNHFDANRTFTSNQDLYTNTAPGPGTEDVTYDAYYDITQLGYNFFTDEGTGDIQNDRLIHEIIVDATENQVVVDAYFVVGPSKVNIPTEIIGGTYVTVYANLTSELGLEPDATVRLTISGAGMGSIYTNDYVTSNPTAEIQDTFYFDGTNISDATDVLLFNFLVDPNGDEFGGSILTHDSLEGQLAVNVTRIDLDLDDAVRYYTTGNTIGYTVALYDEYGNAAKSSSFQLTFPDSIINPYSVASGSRHLDTVIPDYSLNETQTKTITVTALGVSGADYRYVAAAGVLNNSVFNTYFALILTLTDPSGANILDGTTATVFNSTFWSAMDATQNYTLTVTDQWLRLPEKVNIFLTLTNVAAVETSSFLITSSRNWVDFTALNFLTLLQDTHAYVGLSLVATGGDYAPATSITHTINIYGPDNNPPTITGEVITPDPYDPGIHDPYYIIQFDIYATDVGTGIRSVELFYEYLEPIANISVGGWQSFALWHVSGDQYRGIINATVSESQYYVNYYIRVIDFAGHGLDEFGAKQTDSLLYYDANLGRVAYLYSQSTPNIFQLGDFVEPFEEQVPTVVTSPTLTSPYINITVYINDSLVWSGMFNVTIHVDSHNLVTGVNQTDYIVAVMTNIPGTNQWFYQLILQYNYQYDWYYIAYDAATPVKNSLRGATRTVQAVDSDAPVINNVNVSGNLSYITPDMLIEFTATVTDILTSVSEVILHITYNEVDYNITMTRVGTSDVFEATFDLSEIELEFYGNFVLEYSIEADDAVENIRTTSPVNLVVINANPTVQPPGGITGNIGAIIGGVIGGIVALVAVLFLWFNRHSLQTYAKKQTFRRRLRDYLKEIIEDIKKDGLEGRYQEGLIKTWTVVEGIGREFFDLPRYKSQTPWEFSRLLAEKGKIERELMYTLLSYFEKARYGYEEITEIDFNSGLRALLKIVDKIEVGEMKIES